MEQTTAARYLRWAEVEVKELSPIFYDWATPISEDSEVLELINGLPELKRQPNLVFAASRFCGAPVGPYSGLRPWLLSHWREVELVILNRATQTNAAGRSAVELPCLIDADSVPDKLPHVVSRVGIDLNPVDLRDPTQVEWLETLFWPEHDERRRRLRVAAGLVAEDPPRLVKGDLLDNISALIAEAPEDSHVVVFHSAVLLYLEPGRRDQFIELMNSFSEVMWISNEGEDVLPAVASQIPMSVNGRTVLAVNGRPHAVVGPLGHSFERIGSSDTFT